MGDFQGYCAITRLPLDYDSEVFAFIYRATPDLAYRRSTSALHSMAWKMRQEGYLADAYKEWLAEFCPWMGLGTYGMNGWVEVDNHLPEWTATNNIWMVHRWVTAEVHRFETGNPDYTGGLLFSLTEFAFCARIELFPDAHESYLGQQYADKRDRARHLLVASMIERGVAAGRW